MKMLLVKLSDANTDTVKVRISSDVVTLEEAIDTFELFLGACGFILPGSLDIVENAEKFPQLNLDLKPKPKKR